MKKEWEKFIKEEELKCQNSLEVFPTEEGWILLRDT